MLRKESISKSSGNQPPSSVWVLDDDMMMVKAIEKKLSTNGYACRGFTDAGSFKDAFFADHLDGLLLLVDYQLGSTTGLSVIREIQAKGIQPDFMAMTGYGDEKVAVSIMKAGAIDYLVKEKGFIDHIPLAVEAAFKRMELDRKLEKATAALKRSLDKHKKLNKQIREQHQELTIEKAKVEKLLQNILPSKIAGELLTIGTAKARYFPCVSVLYADVEDFSAKSSLFSPIDLVEKLDEYFSKFDTIIDRLKLEKIKTIGDCYMCAGGIPEADTLNPPRAVLAGLQIQDVILREAREANAQGLPYFTMRVGVHTGEVVAGVIGRRKFSYDIWGNAANKAHWMVQSSLENMVNISAETYEYVAEYFECSFRGMVKTKHFQQEGMYFVHRLKPEYADDPDGLKPNIEFMMAAGLA
ncbi:MAG: adenylate/guanylate cyclase domain-containing protein [Bacteroides sp.]|jgi:class 3 adenylate cyclase/CheY-like chemotaxis protein|nr:adenylate/guanylate cyclase domain-containing protein [Bacteroides sp.]